MEEFFKDMNNVKSIGEPNRIICDSAIIQKEISDAISKLKLNKSLGTDGLTSEFYKAFTQLIFCSKLFQKILTKNSSHLHYVKA